MRFSEKHLSYVLAVERAGSFTEAARQLFVSQPALSQVIRQIEEELGLPLFDRKTLPVRLTPAGEEYLRAAREVAAIENRLAGRAGEMKGEVRGSVTLGISVQRGIRLLPEVMPAFLRKYPHLRVHLAEYGSDTLERMVLDGTCDFALITTDAASPRLRYRLVETEEILLIAARETALAARVPDGGEITLKEAEEESFISLAPGHSVRSVQDQLFYTRGIRPRILIESHNIAACLRLTAALNAVMLCPDVYLPGDADPDFRGRVRAYHLREDFLQRHSCLCSLRERPWPAYMEDLYGLLCRACGTRPGV